MVYKVKPESQLTDLLDTCQRDVIAYGIHHISSNLPIRNAIWDLIVFMLKQLIYRYNNAMISAFLTSGVLSSQ